jgi:hypothetical protein
MMTMTDRSIPSQANRWLAPLLAALALVAGPLAAQDVEQFDPDDVYAGAPIDADLADPRSADLPPLPTIAPYPGATPAPATGQPVDPYPPMVADSGGDASGFDSEFADYVQQGAGAGGDGAPQWVDPASGATAGEVASQDAARTAEADSRTFGEDDLIGAAEGVFGKGAEGLARMIEDLLEKEGKPNGYIVGREAGGAFIVGARYGSGTLHHKVEGERKVYWTGPSIGFDAGANAAKTFVLVYNLFDSEDLFKRYPAGEGQAYLIGGLHASYMRRGDVVLIPIRMGAGVRLGVNAGYMKFSKKQRWLPF